MVTIDPFGVRDILGAFGVSEDFISIAEKAAQERRELSVHHIAYDGTSYIIVVKGQRFTLRLGAINYLVMGGLIAAGELCADPRTAPSNPIFYASLNPTGDHGLSREAASITNWYA